GIAPQFLKRLSRAINLCLQAILLFLPLRGLLGLSELQFEELVFELEEFYFRLQGFNTHVRDVFLSMDVFRAHPFLPCDFQLSDVFVAVMSLTRLVPIALHAVADKSEERLAVVGLDQKSRDGITLCEKSHHIAGIIAKRKQTPQRHEALR